MRGPPFRFGSLGSFTESEYAFRARPPRLCLYSVSVSHWAIAFSFTLGLGSEFPEPVWRSGGSYLTLARVPTSQRVRRSTRLK